MTEVVPVSSSAHLTLVPWLLRWPTAPDRTALAAGLHAGSCAGILLALTPRSARPDRRTALLAAATSAPAAVAGLLAAGMVERRLGRPPQLAALLAGAGVALAAADRRPQTRSVDVRAAAVAALAQVAALAPGVSRAGAALTALRGMQVRRAEAERFSLLMSLPVTAGAATLSLARADRAALRALAGPLAVGTPAAAAAAYATTRLRARQAHAARLHAHSLLRFAVYRVALAALTAALVRVRASSPPRESR